MRIFYLALIILCSCGPYREIKTTKLKEGMTRKEVYAALKKKEQKVIGVKEYPQGKLVVYQYITRNDMSDAIEDKMYFYFLNDTLIRFAPPEEWKEGADKALARYSKN